MNKTLKIFLGLALAAALMIHPSLISDLLAPPAGPGGGTGGGGPIGGGASGVPIDGGITALLAAGAAYAGKRFRDKRKQQQDVE